MTTEEANNNLNMLVDLTFTNVNRLFVLAYQNKQTILFSILFTKRYGKRL